jgi:L-lactate dehydrogenase complex protein LldE
MRIALFVTCLTDTFYPRVGEAVVRVLEHLGHDVHFPEAQTCCGQPMFNTGYHPEARDLAKRMIDVFDGEEYVVTPSGSCCAMVHDYYMELLKDEPDWHERARRFVGSCYEFIQFLVQVEQIDLRQLNCHWPARATYHYSCHLRGIGMTDEAVQLLRQIDGLEYLPLNKTEQCCGFGGTFAVKYPEISGAMLEDKIACITDTGADVVVCNDGGCSMNISGGCHRHGVNVRFKHLAEIIAEGLGLMPREE